MKYSITLSVLFLIFTVNGSTFSSFKKSKVVPFELQGNYIILKAIVNNINTDTVRFLFDSGATGGSIDSEFVSRNNIKLINVTTFDIGATGKPIKVNCIKVNSLRLEGNNYLKESGQFTTANFKKYKKLKIQGIIGLDLLKNYCMSINYDTKTIEFMPLGSIIKNETDYNKINFELLSYIPIPKVPITIKTFSNEEFKGDVLFDTGADLNLLFNKSFLQESNLKEKLNPSSKIDTGMAINNQIMRLERGNLKLMSLGNFQIKDLDINLPDKNTNVLSPNQTIGIMGVKVITQFNFILDYSTKTLYLKSRILANTLQLN
jgi:hypothetical protein